LSGAAKYPAGARPSKCYLFIYLFIVWTGQLLPTFAPDGQSWAGREMGACWTALAQAMMFNPVPGTAYEAFQCIVFFQDDFTKSSRWRNLPRKGME
jgi:hypothetical protein